MSYQCTVTTLSGIGMIDVRDASGLAEVSPDTLTSSELSTSIAHVMQISRQHWLVRLATSDSHVNEDSAAQKISDILNESSNDAIVTINSDHYAGVSITGEDTLAVMSQACSLDLGLLSAGDATRCRFARTAAIIHVISPLNHYDVFVESTYQDYLLAWLKEARHFTE